MHFGLNFRAKLILPFIILLLLIPSFAFSLGSCTWYGGGLPVGWYPKSSTEYCLWKCDNGETTPYDCQTIKNCPTGSTYDLDKRDCVSLGDAQGSRNVECSEIKPCAVGVCNSVTGQCVSKGNVDLPGLTSPDTSQQQDTRNYGYLGFNGFLVFLLLLVIAYFTILKKKEQPRNVASFCSKCGTGIDKDSKFCPKCGNKR